MIKEFLAYTTFITILLLTVSGHYLYVKSGIDSQSQKIAQLTKIVEPALGVSGLENRSLALDKSLDSSVYPDMLSIDRVGFVYAK